MAGAASLISIQIDDAEVRARLTALARKAQHLEPALREIGEVLTNSTKQRFADQTGPDGEPWPENKPLTLERYLGRTKGGVPAGSSGDSLLISLWFTDSQGS
jgi:phage gpG-like protein